MKHSHSINENPDHLYTLDPHDIDENTNSAERTRMKKYIDGVLEEFFTERQRQIIRLYFGKKLSSEEISKKIGISPQAVRKIISRASVQIKKHKKIFLKSQPK